MKPAELRAVLNLSLAEFAAVAGVDKQTAWRWERYGQRPRARAILDRLAELESEVETPEGRAAITLRALTEVARQRHDAALKRARQRAEAITKAPA